MSNYILYGTEFSLYSAKVRAYMVYKNIPFEEVLSTAKIYKSVIIPKTGVKFIPVVKTPDDEYLQDSTNIIDRLEVNFPEKSVYPETAVQRLVALLLELYADEWLLMPAMHYRWNHDNFPFIYQEFGSILQPKFPAFIRALIGRKIARKFEEVVPKLGITEKTIPALEKWYEKDFLVLLDKHLSKVQFLLGDKPCIADFGFFGPLYAHLYRDPYPGQFMKENAPNVVEWIKRMKRGDTVEGQFLPNDEIADTLIPLLNHLFDIQWPILEDTANRLAEWYSRETNDIHLKEPLKIPRMLGMHEFKVGGIEEQRMVMPYSQWMMQRPLNYYQSLTSKQKKEVEPLLKKINGLYAMRFNLEVQVTRIENHFVIV